MGNTRISRTNELNAIKQKYGERYFGNPYALKEACELWGIESNDHGVAQGFKEEALVKVGQCSASMKYIETKSGHMLLGLDAMTSIGGFGYAPSIWSSLGFASYWDAKEFAVQKFIKYFSEEAVTKNSCSSKANKLNCKRAAEILRGELTPQLDLF